MRPIVRPLLLTVLLVAATVVPSSAAPRIPGPPVAGLVVTPSTRGFDATRQALVDALEANPAITIVAQVDHRANAASVGLDLPPTWEVFFGNPNLGTPLMQADQVAGIDLPQKLLVWEQDGDTFVGFNRVEYLAARHDLAGVATLDTIGGALATLTSVATGVDLDEVASAATRRDTAHLQRVVRRPGLRSVTSTQSFDDTVASIRAAIDAGPSSEVFTLDHQANAAGVGLDLPPTTLVVFGSPALGTPLMQDRRTIAIDLPQKILVHESATGEVVVTWNDPFAIARRHHVGGERDTLVTIDQALRGLASIGAGLD